MFNEARVLAIIPARGGSKGLPRKNIVELAGKPLIAWTIEAAKRSKYIDRFILSSDDLEIIEVAKTWGCEVPFIRPAALAGDDAPGIGPVLHAIQELSGYDLVVLLQPTSPLRTSEDIDAAIELCVSKNAPACVSVTECKQHPYLVFSRTANGCLLPFLEVGEKRNRRQDFPGAFILNGAVYVAQKKCLEVSRTFLVEETVSYIMPSDRSIDIDTAEDLRLTEYLLS
jgi:N-acylneuraminate cytidylyltransferase